MSNAPRKIWYDTDFLTVGLIPIDDSDTPYIRADIVDELVEALEEVVRISDRDHEAWDKAKAAIAKARAE